jgi:hypothetical protein
MTTAVKSIRHIVEANLKTYLTAQTELSGVAIYTGDSADDNVLPKIITVCDSARAPGDLPEGLGNYLCGVRLTIFSNADDTTLSDHRSRCAVIAGIMQDVASFQAVFTAEGNASLYDVTIGSEDEGVDTRSWATSFGFNVLTVIQN